MAGTSAANIWDFLTKSGSLNTASSGSLQWLVSTWNTLEFGPVLNFAFALVDLVNVMVDILGIGVLIRGVSGIGKSESVLQLIERGYSLVADDVTRITSLEGRELMATAPQVTRYHMEVRGIGIINVASVFGIGAIRVEKRLDLVVTLKDWSDTEEVDRTGLDREFYEILDIKVPHVTIPVRPGRDLARLIEVAAMDQKLKSLGSNAALEFNTKLLNIMETKSADGIA